MKLNRFAAYAWGVLVYTLFVIMWGAYVRATGSGAGCGNHWPTCGGTVIPRAPQIETQIEFTHRLSSSLAGVLVIILLVWAFLVYPKGHIVRRGAGWSFVFIIIEGLLGAALVRFELVAGNASMLRALVISGHLVNTFILLACLALTAWWASGGRPVRWRGRGSQGWILGVGLLAVILLGATGAITALGDTLFPDVSVAEGLRQDFDPTVSFLKRLRIIHPALAMLTGVYIVFIGSVFRAAEHLIPTRRLANGLIGLFFLQLGVGVVNVLLLAPIWMQMIHLLLADLVWIGLLLLAASVMSVEIVRVEGRLADDVLPVPGN